MQRSDGDHAFRLELPLRLAAKAHSGRKRCVHVTTACRPSGPSDARPGRERGRRGHRHRHHPDIGGTGVQRHRFGRLRHRLGWQATARAERIWPLARGMDARVLRRQARSRARLEFGDRARSGVGVGRTARQVRKAPVRKALRTSDLLRPQRLSGLTDRRRAMGGAGAAVQNPAGIRRGVHAGRAGAETRRTVHLSRPRGHAREDRHNQRRSVLPRGTRGQTRSARGGQRRRHARQRPRRSSRRLGRHDQRTPTAGTPSTRYRPTARGSWP